MSKFVVIEVDLDKYHPHWPNERVYKVRNMETGMVSLGCWTRKELALNVANRKNETVA